MNYIKARDVMFSLIRSTIQNFDYVPHVEYPMIVNATKPDASKIWLRASTQMAIEEQSALSTCEIENGKKLYTSYGLIIVEFYIPRIEPDGSLALMWATQLRNAFRNASSDDGVIYRKAQIDDAIEPEESFFRLNVVANFEFDEIK